MFEKVVSFVFWTVIFYCVAAFIMLEINPILWHWSARMTWAIFFVGQVAHFFIEEKKEK